MLSLTHSLKLLLLLADESQIVRQRSAELARVRADVESHKLRATDLCDSLLHEEVLEGPPMPPGGEVEQDNGTLLDAT